jgi:hypothetical protein
MKRKILLYGKGTLGTLAQEILTRLRIDFDIADHACIDGLKYKHMEAIVCIAKFPYGEIKRQLRDLGGIETVQHFYSYILEYPEVGLDNGWTLSRTMVKPVPILFEGRDKKSWDNFIYFRVSQDDQWLVCSEDRYYIPEIAKIFPLDKRGFLDARVHAEHPGSTLADINHRRRVQKYHRKMDYIIIHAEGLELETLWINMPFLRQTRPVLAVNVYHNPDGHYEIPALMKKELTDYYFHFRTHAYYGQAAVIYAIPYEKMQKRSE